MNVMEQIKNKDEWVVGGLIALYNCQTADEQEYGTTVHENYAGFNGLDAAVLSDISEFYLRKGYLTEKQIVFVRRTILKYHRQLTELPVKPLSIKRPQKDNGKPISPLKRAEMNENKILLRFRFPKGDNQFWDTLKFVKAIRFARFNKEASNWTIPFTPENVEKLIEDKWNISEDVRARYRKATAIINPDEDIKIPGLNGTPYPFQYSGISFIDKAGGNALIGDEMGLGKTIQALGWLQLHSDIRPALIVCPASVKYNWAREASNWLSEDNKIAILNGRPNGSKTPKADIYIANYDIISNTTEEVRVESPYFPEPKISRKEVMDTGWGDAMIKIGVKAIIIDECHYIKENKALRTKAIKRICEQSDHVIGLSGTPIENRPKEFFNILNIINPDLFGDWVKYVTTYCGAYKDRWGWKYDNENANGKALHDLIKKNIMIRRLKSEVLKDLPPKRRNVVTLPMTKEGTKEYQEVMKEILTFDPRTDPSIVLTEIERAKQIAVAAKLEAATEWVKDFLDSGNKLVIFCEHQNVADWFQKKFKKECVRITGGTANRQEAIDAFQMNDDIRLFIGSSAVKEGITLTAAADTAFMELWWKPGAHDQAEDRVHRIGQEAESVNAWYLLADGTIEEDLAKLLDAKRKILAETLDGKEPTDLEMLTELWKKLRKEA